MLNNYNYNYYSQRNLPIYNNSPVVIPYNQDNYERLNYFRKTDKNYINNINRYPIQYPNGLQINQANNPMNEYKENKNMNTLSGPHQNYFNKRNFTKGKKKSKKVKINKKVEVVFVETNKEENYKNNFKKSEIGQIEKENQLLNGKKIEDSINFQKNQREKTHCMCNIY